MLWLTGLLVPVLVAAPGPDVLTSRALVVRRLLDLPTEEGLELKRLRGKLRLAEEENSALRVKLAEIESVGEELAFQRKEGNFSIFGGGENSTVEKLEEAVEQTLIPPTMGALIPCHALAAELR